MPREAETPSKLRHWWGRFIQADFDRAMTAARAAGQAPIAKTLTWTGIAPGIEKASIKPGWYYEAIKGPEGFIAVETLHGRERIVGEAFASMDAAKSAAWKDFDGQVRSLLDCHGQAPDAHARDLGEDAEGHAPGI